MPGRREREEKQRTGNETHLQEVTELACQQEVQPNGGEGKYEANQTFRENVQSAGRRQTQQAKRDGCAPSKVRKKNPRLRISQRPTRTSGIRKRVKRYGPKTMPEAREA